MFIRPGPGGGVNIGNMTLKEMIALAWRVMPFQISGGPAWLDTLHYDVIAKPEAKPQQTQIPLMIQALLADRFQLLLHRGTKALPVYALVMARKDGKPGSGLTEPNPANCRQRDPPVLPCIDMTLGPVGLTAANMPVRDLAPALSRLLGRTVVDKTGLTQRFDMKAEWTADETLGQPPPGAATPAASLATASIFTAFQEQLGLKLEAQRGMVEMLIIDRAEKPSEN